jgi:hypothetical protein
MASKVNKLKRERSKNMTNSELIVLVEEVVNNYDKLYGKYSNTNTSLTQSTLWSTISEKLKSLGPLNVERSEAFMRAKFSNLKYQTKAKLLSIKKYKRGTGGGEPPVQLTALEEKISQIISNYLFLKCFSNN